MANNLILLQNPWWQKTEAIENDLRISILATLPVVWHPLAVEGLNVSKDAVHIVTGPRQVGKSTAIRILMKELLLEKKVPPKNLFLFNCDIVKNAKELVELVVDYLENIAGVGRKYIFLDEVTAVEEWPNGIKWLVDNGKGKDVTYILTGSSSINLKKSGEFLPGRRGSGKDVFIRPLTFKEFIKILKPGLPSVDLGAGLSDIRRYYNDLLIEIPDIQDIFRGYLLHGGFLKPLNEYVQTKSVSSETGELYTSWIRGEIAKDKKREATARLMMEKLLLSLGTGLSYQALSQYMDAGSHNTAQAYMGFFTDSFMIDEVPFAELSQKKVAWKKNRKYYFSDPFIYWLITRWVEGHDNFSFVFESVLKNPEKMGAIAENLIETHLRKSGFEPVYGTVRGSEVDFALMKDDIAVEVKFQKKVTKIDAAPLKGFKRSFLVSQNALDDFEGTKVLPAFIFCLL